MAISVSPSIPTKRLAWEHIYFDVEKFGCEWAYTIDGGDIGELEFENFNAASAKITIKGISVHPGYAKGKMVNANALAAEFAGMLPADETPETTDGYQGFYHLLNIQSNIEEAKMSYIIRDHDREAFEDRKRFIKLRRQAQRQIWRGDSLLRAEGPILQHEGED